MYYVMNGILTLVFPSDAGPQRSEISTKHCDVLLVLAKKGNVSTLVSPHFIVNRVERFGYIVSAKEAKKRWWDTMFTLQSRIVFKIVLPS